MAAIVGLDLKLYYNAGTYNSPTWTELTTVKDLKTNGEVMKAEVTARLSTWVMNIPTLKKAALDFGLLRDEALTQWGIIKTAWLNRTAMDMAIANGAIATPGTIYFRADFGVFNFTVNEPLTETST